MFDSLSQKLSCVFDRLRGRGFLNEEEIEKVLREIRIVLLEADVAISAVKALLSRVKDQALGQEVIKSITPGQMIIKIVYDTIIEFLGKDSVPLNLKANSPFSYVFVGLQGVGKTTSVAKIAYFLKKNYNILMVSLDIYRPAAREQLNILGNHIGVKSFSSESYKNPMDIVKEAMIYAKKESVDIILWDTAGRLHIDDSMMQEIFSFHKVIDPVETLLVADSMMGQEAINVAKTFHEKVPLTGLILTRADGDMRGGASLSMRFSTGCPIKFLGIGEQIDQLIPFDPKRIADQILDRGDIVQLVESASLLAGERNIEKIKKRLEKGKFDLNDMQIQLEQMQKMGGFLGILKMIPGAKKFSTMMKETGQDKINSDHIVKRNIALIQSMTPKERRNPQILKGSSRRRIAKGAGQSVMELNRLIKQFQQIQDLTKKISKNKNEYGIKQLFKQSSEKIKLK